MSFRQPFSYADSMGKLWWVIRLEPISAHVVSIRPFVLQLALVNNKENIQGSRYWPCVTRIDQWLVDFTHKDQCITESFPCRDVTKKQWRDVLTMSARQCRQSAEGVPQFISASKFCSGPKSRRGKFDLAGRRRNARKRSGATKTVKGIFRECADKLPNHADL